jgi:hypothetical protein
VKFQHLTAKVVALHGAEDYAAFVAKDKVGRLRIRGAKGQVNAPSYSLLLNLVYDEHGTHFVLVYTILTVLVRGRNLQKMVFAIENGMADFIQEFDAARWKQPAAGAPLISSLEVRMNEHSEKSGHAGR